MRILSIGYEASLTFYPAAYLGLPTPLIAPDLT
jgi:hypothetical protein